MSNTNYKKGDGTSGIRGQLYETKLLSLIFYRAKHDDSVEQFQLASNIADIGAFDDICFKAKVNGFAKPLAVFVQAKHKDDSDQAPTVELMKYFRSFLKIRESFESQDEFFQGEFQETECFFVIYTSGKDSFANDSVDEVVASKLNELIGTGGTAKQPYKHKADEVASLCEALVRDQTVSLAKQIATFMFGANKLQDMMSHEVVLLYHFVLAQKVFDVSDIQPAGHRVATFREDFFNTRDEYLILFKNALYQEIISRRAVKPAAIKSLLSDFLAKPTDVTKLSKLIGTVVIYNNGQLELVKKYSKYGNQQLSQVQISRSTVNEAIELAARDIMTKGINVPAAFGNKDLTLNGNEAKKERRVNYLTSIFIDILDKSKPNNCIVIDESVDKGFLQLNGGIAGAVGSIFVFDDDTKSMKITDSCEYLGTFAKSLYTKLVNEIHNLHEYKFYFNVNKFPKLAFAPSDYEGSLARDFLNKLLFYSKQAGESEVEIILKNKIEDYQRDHPNYFQAKTDAMFLKYHDEIQKWWMEPKQAVYLNKNSDKFEKAINSIMKDPLISSIHITYLSKIQHFKYTFREDVASSWSLQDHSSTVIITENSVLTVVKVLQHLKNKDHAVLDLEYIVNLPTNDRNALRSELASTKDHKILVIVCDGLRNNINEIKTLEVIAAAVLTKKTIIVSNPMSRDRLQKFFPSADNNIQDETNSLLDMSEESQKSILEAGIMFQGKDISLNLILDDESKAYLKGDVLNSIISQETIVVSKLIIDREYDEIKHLYVDRRVKKTSPYTKTPLDNSLPIQTLFDIEDDVVVVTAEPGMGKSTLLTHLSLETKTKFPNVWIVRVNLLEFSREFGKWKQEETVIDTLETLTFMCRVILREKRDDKGNNIEFELKEHNGAVYLVQCAGDQLTEFELRLFLHLYNKGRMIFLFDGFDEICPHYAKEVIACINIVYSHTKKHKLWITSRSYIQVMTYLQQAFGFPYEIEHLSYSMKKEYLLKIWQSNLILKELDELQLQNVHDFLQFMNATQHNELQIFELPLQEIYIDAALFMINEIKTTSIPLWTFNNDYDDRCHKVEEEHIFRTPIYEDNSDRNPLHLYLRAHVLIDSIKDPNRDINKWNRNANTYTFYQKYLETKLKNIRFAGKNKMDIYNPDIMIAYDKELADFVAKHKKLAAYAMFNQDIDKLFSKNDVAEIKEIIKFIGKAGEKTGLIYGVATIGTIEIPIFVHMTFAEYFAVEYLCDLIKHETDSETQLQRMDFVFSVLFSVDNFRNIRTIFDYKMKIDKTLMTILDNHKEVIFNILFEQSFAYAAYLDNDRTNRTKETSNSVESARYWPPVEAATESLHSFTSLFAAIFNTCLNDNNLTEFLAIAREIGFLPMAVVKDCDELVVCVFDKIKTSKSLNLNDVLRRNFSYLSRSRNYNEIRSEEIVQIIRKDYLDEHNRLRARGATPPSLMWLYQV